MSAVELPPAVAFSTRLPEPEIERHRMCANCGHVRHEDDAEPHFSMPSMGLRCSGRGTPDSPIFVWLAPFGAAWSQHVATVTAQYATCPDCAQRIRVRAGVRKLVMHQRPPRPGDRARSRWVDCAGSGRPVVDPAPGTPPINLSLEPQRHAD